MVRVYPGDRSTLVFLNLCTRVRISKIPQSVMVHILESVSCWPGLLPVWPTHFHFPKQKHTGHLILHTHLLVQTPRPPCAVHHKHPRESWRGFCISDWQTACWCMRMCSLFLWDCSAFSLLCGSLMSCFFFCYLLLFSFDEAWGLAVIESLWSTTAKWFPWNSAETFLNDEYNWFW